MISTQPRVPVLDVDADQREVLAISQSADQADRTGRLACILALAHVLQCDVEQLRTLRWGQLYLTETALNAAVHAGVPIGKACGHCLRWGAIAWPGAAGSGANVQPLGTVSRGALERYLRRRSSGPLPAHSVWVFPDVVRGALPISRPALRGMMWRVAQIA